MATNEKEWWTEVVESETKGLKRQQKRKQRPIDMPGEFQAIVKALPKRTVLESVTFLERTWKAYVEKERDAVFEKQDVELAEAYAMVKGGVSALIVTAMKETGIRKDSKLSRLFPHFSN